MIVLVAGVLLHPEPVYETDTLYVVVTVGVTLMVPVVLVVVVMPGPLHV